MGLFPRNEWFFIKFEEQSKNVLDTSQILLEIINASMVDPLWKKFMNKAEGRGDLLAKELIQRAQSTFVTPLDQEDIYELAHTVDNVLDYLEEAVERIVAYGIVGDQDLNSFLGILREALRWLNEGILQLKPVKFDRFYEINEKIIECEHAADKLIREVIASSYNLDARAILEKSLDSSLTVWDIQKVMNSYNYKRKCREIAEILEKASDACRHVFHILGNIKLKNG